MQKKNENETKNASKWNMTVNYENFHKILQISLFNTFIRLHLHGKHIHLESSFQSGETSRTKMQTKE